MKSLFNFQYLFHLLVVLFHNASGNVIINSDGLVSRDIQDVATCPVNIWEPCVIRETGTSVVNEDPGKYPSGYTRIYQYQPPQGTCQMRLDFNFFELGGPDSAGNCNADSMIVGGLTLCGNNTGQHMYMEFGDSSTILVVARISNSTRIYNITSTFIECNSGNEAPPNCVQYYTALGGSIRSLNYPQQTNNLQYAVCIKPFPIMNKIQWRPCPDSPDTPSPLSFHVSGHGLEGSSIGNDCPFDFVQINGLYRYCGDRFQPVMTSAKPFMLSVNFDQIEGLSVSFGEQCPGVPIYDPLLGGTFTCAGIPPDNPTVCTCIYTPHSNPPRFPEYGNTGFCLEYTQLP